MLIPSIVAEKYALAFFNLAREHQLIGALEEELQEIVDLFKENKDLRQLLYHPLVSRDDKKLVLEKILGDHHLYTRNLLFLLVDKGRLAEIESLAAAFSLLWEKEQNIVTAEIKAARPLQNDLAEALQKKLEGLTGKKVKLNITVDESLIGGLTIRLGDFFIDGSIKRDLEKLQEQLHKLQVGKVG